MSIQRLKRIIALEKRQPTSEPWTDPYPLAMALWEAFKAEWAAERAHREFGRVPRREPAEPMSEEAVAALELAMREYDRMHEKLTSKPLEAA